MTVHGRLDTDKGADAKTILHSQRAILPPVQNYTEDITAAVVPTPAAAVSEREVKEEKKWEGGRRGGGRKRRRNKQGLDEHNKNGAAGAKREGLNEKENQKKTKQTARAHARTHTRTHTHTQSNRFSVQAFAASAAGVSHHSLSQWTLPAASVTRRYGPVQLGWQSKKRPSAASVKSGLSHSAGSLCTDECMTAFKLGRMLQVSSSISAWY